MCIRDRRFVSGSSVLEKVRQVDDLELRRNVRGDSRREHRHFDRAEPVSYTHLVVLAMGCRERTRGALSIPGHRPAGVYTAGTVQNLVNLENIMPGDVYKRQPPNGGPS